MSKKQVDFEIIDYDTGYLDDIEGSVVDVQPTALATTHATTHAAITRPSRGNLVLPTTVQTDRRPDLGGAGAMLMAGNGLAAQIMTGNEAASRATQHDNAITVADAALKYSWAYTRAALPITVSLLVLTYLFVGGPFLVYGFVGMLVWGLAILGALLWNRAQGLKHSSTGIAHASISSNERVAMHAIDKAHETYKELVERTYGGRHV